MIGIPEEVLECLINNQKLDGFKVLGKSILNNEYSYTDGKIKSNQQYERNNTVISVYKKYIINNKKYIGSYSFELGKVHTIDKFNDRLEYALINTFRTLDLYYPLPKKDHKINIDDNHRITQSQFQDFISDVEQYILSKRALYNISSYETLYSSTRETNHIRNSNGLHIVNSTTKYRISVNTTNIKDNTQSTYNDYIEFSELDFSYTKERIDRLLKHSFLYNSGLRMVINEEITTFITGKTNILFLEYYMQKSTGTKIYYGLSKIQVNDSIEEKNTLSDHLSMMLKPFLKYSSKNKLSDNDGTQLREHTVIKDSKLKLITSMQQYGFYLGVEPTGSIGNMIVSPGKKSVKLLKEGKYIVAEKMDSFTVNHLSGEFIGKVKIGKLIENNNETIIKDFKIQGSINSTNQVISLSKETTQFDNYYGPSYIKINNVKVESHK